MRYCRNYDLRCVCWVAVIFAIACGKSLFAQDFALIVDEAPNAMVQNALQKRLRMSLEPILKVELSFAIRAAKPTDDQRRALIAAAAIWLDQFADEFAQKKNQNEQQMWLQGLQQIVIGGPPEGGNPRTEIESGVAKLVEKTLPEEKAAAYKKEAKEREAFRREATVDQLVEQLDEKLILSAEQRAKIASSLSAHWDSKWAPELESFQFGGSYFMPVPGQWVQPELTPAQRIVFDRLNSSSRQIIFGAMALGRNGGLIDDVDLPAEPVAAEPAPAGPQPVVANPQHDVD
jgi:hypothetical protein